MKKLYSTVIVGLLLIFSQLNVTAQHYTVKRGERPAIDLKSIPKEAYESNFISIKLAASENEVMEQFYYSAEKQMQTSIGISKVDELNAIYSIKSATPKFSASIMNPKYAERHKAWGFHRWVTIELSEGSDIIEMINAYMALDEVEHAEPIYKKRLIGPVSGDDHQAKETGEKSTDWIPNDPRFDEQWHYHNTGQQNGTPGRDISLPEAWEIETGSSEVIVAVIDEGVQYTHPDLAGNMWEGNGFNFVNNTSNIVPGDHGTHVAGTISAENNNNLGVSGVAGGTGSGDGVRIMSCQVFQGNSNGGFDVAPIWAADNNAAISQNSWGYSYPNSYEQSVLDAIDYFNINGGSDALDGGITIFAAGNDDASGQWWPGCYEGSFAVAGTNNKDEKSWYSNYDTWVDISAPGGETNTVTSRGVLSTKTNNSYGFFQGTSMACPHTSGVAALMISLAYGQLSNEDVAEILRSTTDDHYDVNPSFIGKLGTGRLNALQALQETQNYLTGVLNPKSFTASATSPNDIALSWELNNNNDNVLLIWSTTNDFGEPVEGTSYNVGQTLPGGGTVLYKGNGVSFDHGNLTANTRYFYKIFAYNSQLLYSSGRATSSWTDCEILTTLPYEQDFNESPSLPNCWTIQDNAGTGQVWSFGTINNGLNGTTGNYAFVNSDGYGYSGSQNTDLISPLFDLSEYMNVQVEFKHYFRSYSTSSGSLHYSINGGASWTQVASWSTTTSNPEAYSVVIEELTGQDNVLIKWNYTGSWAYYWCVDDIVISGESNITGAPTMAQNPVPTNNSTGISTDGTLNWTWGNNTNKYDLWFGPAGNMTKVISQGNGGAPGASASYNYSGLSENTNYQWQVVSYNTDIGMHVEGPVWSFRTEFGVITLPFYESFEAEFSPYGWEIFDEDGNATVRTWEQTSSQNHTSGGSKSAYHNYSPSSQTEDGWLVTPKIALPTDTGLELSFWNYNTFPTYYSSGKNSVLISTGSSSPAGNDFVEVWSPASVEASWVEATVDLSSYAGQEIYIAFRYQGSNAHAWYLDDVSVESTSPNPIISVNPNSLNETLAPNETSVKQVTVTNTGNATLEFDLEVNTGRGVLSYGIVDAPVVSIDQPKLTADMLTNAATVGQTESPNRGTLDQVIRYDNGINDDAIGLNGGGTFEVSAYWPASSMAQYAGMELEKVEMYINSVPSAATLKIYGAGSAAAPGSLIYSQSFSGAESTWVMVELDTPVAITGGDIWIGYEVTHADGQWPAGCDAGPAAAGFGDMIALGGAWDPISSLGFNVNWNIAAYLAEGSGQTGEWLSAAPLSAVVPAGSSVTIDVSFDATGLAEGTYEGSLVFNSNDLSNPVVTVPVTLEVESTATPVITVNPASLYQHFFAPGDTETQILTIGNTGDGALEWSAAVQYTSKTVVHPPVPEGPVTNAYIDLSVGEFEAGGSPALPETREDIILHYDGENQGNAIGLTGGGDFHVSARFPAAMVSGYSGFELKEVDVFVNDMPTSMTLYIRGAGTTTAPGTVLHQQTLNPTNGWNTFVLSTPVILDGNDLWVGYQVSHAADQFPAGCDGGPANPNGDWLSMDGNAWQHMADLGLDYNWNIRALISGSSWLTLGTSSGTVAPGANQQINVYFDSEGLEIGAYTANILISSNDIATPVKTVPVQMDVGVGVEENDMANVQVYPVPANSILFIDLVEGVRQIRMMNIMGQIVKDETVNGELRKTIDLTGLRLGTYTLQFINDKGQVHHKTIIISK